MEKKSQINCAIYTRKSTDEGLEKEFNTLEAQREAGESYVNSQKHQGWVALPEHYDDGGFSGGNMNRPALQKLIEDVKHNKVQMIVVYKIDRLTRSLMDFSKLIDILDKHNCSFVSVTQNFNTSDSMGRLTLNMLLSFAQFEREVSAERIRDKVAASKKKGMWMGGVIPYGYDIKNKKLIINQKEAEIVTFIYKQYVLLKSERDVCNKLKNLGYHNKPKRSVQNEEVILKPFSLNQVSNILKNPIYQGKIPHKDKLYDGQHKAIISESLWSTVSEIRNNNKGKNFNYSKNVYNNLLTGFLECSCCHSSFMTTRTSKKNKTYEYYVTTKAVKSGYASCELGNIPVGELDNFIIEKMQNIMKSPALINELSLQLEEELPEFGIKELLEKMKDPSDFFNSLPRVVLKRIFEKLISKIILHKDKIVIRLLPLGAMLLETTKIKELKPCCENSDLMELTYKVDLAKKRGHLKILPSNDEQATIDDVLLKAVVKAHAWRKLIEKGKYTPVTLSEHIKLDRSYIDKIIKLTNLAPDIIEAIMLGKQPNNLTLKELIYEPIPVLWSMQRQKYGFLEM